MRLGGKNKKGVCMDMPIIPTGGPTGRSPIEPNVGETNRPEVEQKFEPLPLKGGESVSPDQIMANCDKLRQQAPPEALEKVISAASEAGGKMPIGPLVTSAMNADILAAIFASIPR